MTKIAGLAGTVAAFTIMAAGAVMAQDAQTITTVVKVTGENWFIRMNEGVDQFNAENDAIDASQVGPAQADAAQQARIIVGVSVLEEPVLTGDAPIGHEQGGRVRGAEALARA